MTKRKRLLAIAVLLALIWSLIAATPISAQANSGGDSLYTKKIVAVVYDNSGSMTDTHERAPAALYSLSILMSMLSEQDTMFIYPMNHKNNVNNGSFYIDVDLSDEDSRQKVINDITEYGTEDNGVLKPQRGGTPSESLTNSIELLQSYLNNNKADEECWLVVLTDGQFDTDGVDGETTEEKQANVLNNAVKEYPNLHTIYLSFGNNDKDTVDISDVEIIKNNPQITCYCQIPEVKSLAGEGEDYLATVMEKVANQIASRYTVDNSSYVKVNGDTVTVDLADLGFSLSSVSVIAQNCGATIESVSYSGTTSVKTQKVCTIEPTDALAKGLKSGCTFEVAPTNGYLSGGELTLKFDGPVDPTCLSVIAEPALDVEMYIEGYVSGEWKEMTADEVNQKLHTGDKIRVGYRVNEKANGKGIDLQKVFGGNVVFDASITNANNSKSEKASANATCEFILDEGENLVNINVSVLNGAYNLRDSEVFNIRSGPNPTEDFITASGPDSIPDGGTTADITFSITLGGAPATKDALKDYEITYYITNGAGENLKTETVKKPDSGEIIVPLEVVQNQFDTYTVTLEAVKKDDASFALSASHTVKYELNELTLTYTGSSGLIITQYNLNSNTQGYTFELTANGQPFNIDSSISYTVTVGDKDVTAAATVDGNKLTYIPAQSNLGSLVDISGDHEVIASIRSLAYPDLTSSASSVLTIDKTLVVIEPVDGQPNIDRFNLATTDAVLYFKVLRDDVPLNYNDMMSYLNSGLFNVEASSLFTNPLLPAGLKDPEVVEANGIAVLAIRPTSDMSPYFDWHMSAFIFGKNAEVTVRVGDDTPSAPRCTQEFNLLSSNPLVHIFRIFVLLVELAVLAYIITYIVGFFVAKPLPKGMFVTVPTVDDPMPRTKKVNMTPWPIIKWHLLRFVQPHKVLQNQPIDGQAPSLRGCTFVSKPKGNPGICIQTTNRSNLREGELFNGAFDTAWHTYTAALPGANRGFLANTLKTAFLHGKNMFRITNNTPIQAGSSCSLSRDTFYLQCITEGKRTTMVNAITFVPLTRRRRRR